MEHTRMTPSDDVSLFIGILPGADQRTVVLFPDGQVIAELRERQISTAGYSGSDRGMIAASLLIGIFRSAGWEIEETPHAGAVWMKPLLRGIPGGLDEESPGETLSAG
jgi:hypothetical protein